MHSHVRLAGAIHKNCSLQSAVAITRYCTYVFSSAARIVSLRQTHSRLVVCRTAVASSSSLPFQQRMPHASFFC